MAPDRRADGLQPRDALTLIAAAAYAGHLLVTDRAVKAEADTVVPAFH